MDFTFWLVVLTILSGLIWAVDRFYLQKKRVKAALDAGLGPSETLKLPMIADYARSFFPVLLIVLVLRSFVVEPFRIPSGSMEPTLLVGDFLLVNKFKYGIEWPLTDKPLVKFSAPKRGDVIVFRWPVNASVPFIKRIVGVPGDRLSYLNKRLYVNGKLVKEVSQGQAERIAGAMRRQQRFQENLLGVKYPIYKDIGVRSFSFKDLKVPQGEYFVMGDNRDNSEDSRYWGFVPRENIIGQAFFRVDELG
ncbi:signal peptidase I [Piscirickettsia litoralis]|uniref:signal peptidase I n=1 Tax=Piscirickettsia litoralis TaxID=1891921 RepID=UPI000A572769|nr:signal peptidase I [Piscirickettsia litoralis]